MAKRAAVRRAWPGWAGIALLGSLPALAAADESAAAAAAVSTPAVAETESVRASHGGITTWHLNLPLLRTLGARVTQVSKGEPMTASRPAAPAGRRSSFRVLEFAALDQTRLQFRESRGLPRAFSGGALRHAGGFVLEFPGGRADLRGFTLQPNARAPFALDVVGGDGHAWFTLDRGHYQLEDSNRTLAMRYMNLRVSAYFAAQLRRAEFAGLALGGMDSLSPLDELDAQSVVSGACSAPWPGQGGAQADIRMVYQAVDAESGMPDAIHFRRCGLPDAGGAYQDADCTVSSTDRGVVFAPDTSLLNVGTAAVSWHQMFARPAGGSGFPPYGNDQHPMLIWNLYRVDADGALRQLAASGVKHAFNTINNTCGCSDHTNNYPGCEDSYSQTSNDIDALTTPNFLGPRSEIIPARGVWGRCLSVFDKNCDAYQDADAGAQNDFQYRLVVPEREISASLQPGAQFYFEYWYVVRDQEDIYDAMGFRPITFNKIAGSGSAFQWSASAGTFANGAVINRWVDPAVVSASMSNTELATPEGHARIALRTTALGGGLYRYDYAVMNLDFARAVIDPAHALEPNLHVLSADGFSALSIPANPSTTITGLAFADADQNAGNDWTATRTPSGIRWQAPPGTALNWGTLYRFAFTADHAPLAAAAMFEVATAGTPTAYTAATLAPLDDVIFADGFEGG